MPLNLAFMGSIPCTRVGGKEVTLGTSQISTKDTKKRKRLSGFENNSNRNE